VMFFYALPHIFSHKFILSSKKNHTFAMKIGNFAYKLGFIIPPQL